MGGPLECSLRNLGKFPIVSDTRMLLLFRFDMVDLLAFLLCVCVCVRACACVSFVCVCASETNLTNLRVLIGKCSRRRPSSANINSITKLTGGSLQRKCFNLSF